MNGKRPRNIRELREAGHKVLSVKEEMRKNLIGMISSGEELFPGIIGFDDTVTSPVDPLLWATDFTTPYSTVAGTFAITWDANGIFRFSIY